MTKQELSSNILAHFWQIYTKTDCKNVLFGAKYRLTSLLLGSVVIVDTHLRKSLDLNRVCHFHLLNLSRIVELFILQNIHSGEV